VSTARLLSSQHIARATGRDNGRLELHARTVTRTKCRDVQVSMRCISRAIVRGHGRVVFDVAIALDCGCCNDEVVGWLIESKCVMCM
jgi:hypothetical protein